MRRGETGIGRWALAGAIAAHAALIGAFMMLPVRHRPAPSRAAATPVAIEVFEVLDPPQASTAAPLGASADERTARLEVGSAPYAPREHALGGGETAAPDEAPPSAPESTAPFRGVTMGAVQATPAIGLELGGPNRFASRDAVPSAGAGRDDGRERPRTAAETKRAVEAALRQPARRRERELGLGPEGPVLRALGAAASASTAPVTGRAVFVAIADGNGVVIGIDVVECDGGRSGWAQAAELARAALVGTKLRLPSTARRAEMRIEITSAWKMPTGHDPGTDVSLFGLPVAKGEGKKSTKVSILDPIPKLRMVELAPDIKVPVVSVNVDVLSVAGDPANIGAKPRRIVHTRLIDSKVL